MTPEDLQLLGDLRKLLGHEDAGGQMVKPNRAWTTLLLPALARAKADALARMRDMSKSAAERGEFASAYNAVEALERLLPDRLAQLERAYDAFNAARK